MIRILLLLICVLFAACGEGVIGTVSTSTSAADDHLNPNPDRLVLSIWDDARPWETDITGDHYVALERLGATRLAVSLLRGSNESPIDSEALSWTVVGDYAAFTVAPEGRVARISANRDQVDDGVSAEPSVTLTAIYDGMVASVKVVSVVDTTGEWTFVTRGSSRTIALKQIGRTVITNDDETVFGEVTKDGLQLTVGRGLYSGLFHDREHLIGAYVAPDGMVADFTGRKSD